MNKTLRLSLITFLAAAGGLGCEVQPMVWVFNDSVVDKNTVTACLPEPGPTVHDGGSRSEGSALAGGHFFGGASGPSSSELPAYAMGPSKILHEDVAVADPRNNRVLIYEARPDGAVRMSYELKDPYPFTKPLDEFGAALAAENINPAEDLRSELAIGVPGRQCGEDSLAGAVQLCTFIGEGTPCCMEEPICNPRSLSREGPSGAGDEFGRSIVWGNFDDDELSELAVGAPFTDEDGAVWVYEVELEVAEHASSCADARWTVELERSELLMPPEFGSSSLEQQFGFALAAGQLLDDPSFTAGGLPIEELVVSSPWGGKEEGGSVHVYRTEGNSLLNTRSRDLVQPDFPTSWGYPTDSEFGWSLAVGDLDADGREDLAIGGPASDLVCYTRVNFSAWIGRCFRPLATSASNERFGHALAIGNFDGAALDRRSLDLAVGSPDHGGGTGAVTFVYGGADRGWPGLMAGGDQAYDTTTITPSGGGIQQKFGAAIAAVNLQLNEFDDVVAGVPGFRPSWGNPATGGIVATRNVPNAPAQTYGDGSPFGVWSGTYERPHGLENWKVRFWEDPRRPLSSYYSGPDAGDVQLFFAEEPEDMPIFRHCFEAPENMRPLEDCGVDNLEQCHVTVQPGADIQLLKSGDGRTSFFNDGAGCLGNPYQSASQYTLCEQYWLHLVEPGVIEVTEYCDEAEPGVCAALQVYAWAAQVDPSDGHVETFEVGGFTTESLGDGYGYLCFGSWTQPAITFVEDPADTEHLECEGP